jgi:hypothetical protein
MRGTISQPGATLLTGSPLGLTTGYINNINNITTAATAAMAATTTTTTTSIKYHARPVPSVALQSMRLKMAPREVSERRQVGDAEEMLSSNAEDDTKGVWWRNVGMEEGM